LGGGAGSGDVVEFGELAAVVEGIVIGEAVEELGHPPGEALDFPDAAETGGGVLGEEIGGAGGIERAESGGEDADVGNGEIQSFGAGGGNDVGGVAGEVESAELHGFDDEAAHAGDTFLDDGTFGEFPAIVSGEALLQFVPDAVVGPEREIFVRRALQIEAADFRRTHGEKSEAAVVVCVDEFVGGRRSLGEDAKPAERIVAFVGGKNALRDGGAGDAVEAVAAGDEVTVEAFSGAIEVEGDVGICGVDGVELDVGGFEEKRMIGGDTFSQMGGDEVLDDFMLGVDGDALAVGEFAEVDAMAAIVEAEFDAAVFETVALEAVGDAEFVHELDGGVFEEAGADAVFDVGAGVEFEDDGVDAEAVEEKREEEAGGAGADDGYLGAHGGEWLVTCDS